MKTAICYYSHHHGNTRKVLEAMAEAGGVDLFDVSAGQPVRLEEYDCIGFASGIYGFEMHKSVVELARQSLPPGETGVFRLYLRIKGRYRSQGPPWNCSGEALSRAGRIFL